MTEQDVRDMLRTRASSITPSTDAIDKIEARLDEPVRMRSRTRVPLLAAAVIVVVALVGVVVFVDRDDSTNVASGPHDTVPAGPAAFPFGVFPWSAFGEPVDDPVFEDPLQTARAYVASRITDVGATTDGGLLQGDAESAEVVFSGHVSTTVFVRRIDTRWFVVGSASDLVTLHDSADGTPTARVETGGLLTHVRELSTGIGEDATPVQVQGGEEYQSRDDDLGGGEVAVRERWVLDTVDGTVGITEIAFPAPSDTASAVPPAGAVSSAGGLEARETVVDYLDDRLDGRKVTVNDFTEKDATHGEVTWEAGVVLVERSDGRWFVTEAIGDSVQLGDLALDGGSITGTVTTAQAGTLHFTVGDSTWDVPIASEKEGTVTAFSHDVAVTGPVVVRVVFDTATGFVSLAEQSLVPHA